MKSTNFTSRAQDSNIRGVKEKKAPRKTNWDRIVYLIFLIIVLIIVFYFIFPRFIYVKGQGYLIPESIEVRAPGDLKIDQICVEEGEDVQEGALLFYYTLRDDDDNNGGAGGRAVVDKHPLMVLDAQNDLAKIQDKIDILRQKLATQRKKLALYQDRENRIEKEVKLHVSTINKLFEAQKDIKNIKGEIADILVKLNAMLGNSKQAKDKLNVLSGGGTAISLGNGGGDYVGARRFESPVNGKIKDIDIYQNELMFRSETTMHIALQSPRLFFYAFFDRDDSSDLLPGMVMTIDFDNGEESKGIVYEIYPIRSDWPYFGKKNWRYMEDRMVVQLVPIDKEALKKWKSIGRMGANVYRFRY